MSALVNRPFYVYILTNRRNGTLYVGFTDNLGQRVWLHKQKAFAGFTAKYNVDSLVWYETHETRESAFLRERQIKKWNRAWKLRLIEEMNPDWNDLFETLEPAIV
jgi:putative endonuclease